MNPPSSSSSHMTSLESELYMHTFQGKWEKVVELYETKQEVWNAEITSSGDTALHMAINEDKDDTVVNLVGIIIREDGDDEDDVSVIIEKYGETPAEKALKKKNEVGETPLHRAAARGSVKMCRCIMEAGNKINVDLLRIKNDWGETPIFVAALHNRKLAFNYLQEAAHDGQKDELLISPVTGDTVLHSTIRREHYDLAFSIIQLCPDLLGRYNVKGMTPLHILASKPSAFKSGYHLSWWWAIIYYSISVDPLKYDGSLLTRTTNPTRSSEFQHPKTTDPNGSSKFERPKNYVTCYHFLSSFRWCSGTGQEENDPEKQYDSHYPENYTTCFQFLFMVLRNLFGVLGFGKTFDEIIEARQKHTWSVQILDELMKDPGKAYMTKGGSDPGPRGLEESHDSPETLLPFRKPEKDQKGDDEKKDVEATKRTDTALLVAAQKGVVEVVNKILQRLPVSIHDTSTNKKNIVLVAVENRQPRILDVLDKHLNEEFEKPKLWQDHIRAVDSDDNNILHLAAMYDDSVSHPWQIHGSAMQMQWEIKWFEHVKSFLPPHFVFLANKQDKTPGQIFTVKHKDLVKDSSEWLKDTSESCSVVAALVAGVSFATSSQVPGGIDDETGKPKLEGRPAFELFAVTALIGLCFSVTALIMFLSILTSRKQPKDFRRNLPLKLLLGLSSLFVSITSMLVSFCAAHFFVLEDKFKSGVFPLYAATCLPVSIYAIAQFPLYVDLLKAIIKRVPQPQHFDNL